MLSFVWIILVLWQHEMVWWLKITLEWFPEWAAVISLSAIEHEVSKHSFGRTDENHEKILRHPSFEPGTSLKQGRRSDHWAASGRCYEESMQDVKMYVLPEVDILVWKCLYQIVRCHIPRNHNLHVYIYTTDCIVHDLTWKLLCLRNFSPFWNPNVCYSVHKSRPFGSILSAESKATATFQCHLPVFPRTGCKVLCCIPCVLHVQTVPAFAIIPATCTWYAR
jgi:hypothetical protein